MADKQKDSGNDSGGTNLSGNDTGVMNLSAFIRVPSVSYTAFERQMARIRRSFYQAKYGDRNKFRTQGLAR